MKRVFFATIVLIGMVMSSCSDAYEEIENNVPEVATDGGTDGGGNSGSGGGGGTPPPTGG